MLNLEKFEVAIVIPAFNEEDTIEEIHFGKGFGCITDIEIIDDTMYVVSLTDGTIYKIFLNDLL